MNKSLAIIICLFLIFGANAFGADTGILSGKVTADNSLQTIYDARIILYNSHKEIVDSAFTSQNGHFEIGLVAGDYYLSAESGNFIREYYPSAYQISEADKIVVYAGQNVSVNFSLDRGGWLGGVFDYLGTNIERGLVTALKIDEPYAGWTKSVVIAGNHPANYVLKGLIPGAYKIAAMASAKQTVFYPGVIRIEDADIIYVERNVGVPDISFILEPVGFGQVRGRVYDITSGEGLDGIPIYAYQWQEFWTDPNMQSVETTGDGLFAFNLPEGDYYFFLNCNNCFPGGGRIAYYYDNQYNPMMADKVHVYSGTVIAEVDFAIDLNISYDLSISGNIVNLESGLGLSDVVVTAIDYPTGHAVSSTYSISNGDFAIENLPAGDYLLQYSGSRVIPFFYRSSESWQGAEIIILTVNHSGIEEEAITQDYGNLGLAISGTVSTPHGRAAGVRVYAYPVGQEDPIAFGITDASGEYSITAGLVNGNYTVACDLIGYDFDIYPANVYLNLLEHPAAENIDFLLEPAVTSVADHNAGLNMPARIEVLANYPNPFNASTNIEVFSGSDVPVRATLQVFNILGQIEGEKATTLHPGLNYIEWNGNDFGRDVSSGIYFYRIEGAVNTNKMVFLK